MCANHQDEVQLCDTKYNQLASYRKVIRGSTLISQIRASLGNEPGFSVIRCLALGSPTASRSALFQLALLIEVASIYKVRSVSVYDPVFCNADRALLERLHYDISETLENAASDCLFFLPHADLELTEEVLMRHEPHWLLSNNILHHTERMPRYRVHEKFRTISLLLERIERSQTTANEAHLGEADEKKHQKSEIPAVLVDGFVAAPTGRKKGRKHNVYVPPPIEFNFEDCCHESALVVPLDDGGSKYEWGNAFSSLATHLITHKASKEAPKETDLPYLHHPASLSETFARQLNLDSRDQ